MSVLLGLRASLEQVLADQLGTYTLANGATTPAVRVSSPDDRRQPGTTVSGVELVIVKEPTLVPVRQYEQERPLSEWTLYLVGWDIDSDITHSSALIQNAFAGCTTERVTVPDGVGPQNQIKVTLLQGSYLTDTTLPNFNGRQISLSDLSDVALVDPTAGEALKYDGANWTDGAVAVPSPARRHDFASPYDYCGTAPAGSSESAAVWTITRISVASNGTTTTGTATGASWTGRASATYS